MACKAITGAWKCTPSAALEIILNLPPLHIFIETEAIATLDSLAKQNGNSLRDVYHTRLWSRTIAKDPSFNMPTDEIIPVFKFDKKFNSINGVLPPEHGSVWYTDGSLIEKSAGARLYCNNPPVDAILECAHENAEMNKSGDNIFICSDSQAAIKALSSYKFTSALALETWEA